jgi:hypothetical protein
LGIEIVCRFAKTKTPMSNKQQTAVDWLVEQLPLIQQEGLRDIIEQAKEMEKDKMENLWDEAISHGGCKCYDEIMTFEEYYNETFNK